MGRARWRIFDRESAGTNLRSFWKYLKDRLGGGSGVVEYLPDLIRKQAQNRNA